VLAISKRTLWELTRRGSISFVRIGRAVRYSLVDIEAYINQQREVRTGADANSQMRETEENSQSPSLKLEGDSHGC